MDLGSLWATYESVVQFVGLNAILALSIYITLAAGQLSLGQAALAGVGAYVAALLTMNLGWPFPLVLAAGILGAGFVALVLGAVVLRLRGVYLAIATLGFGAVFGVVLLNIPITGGAEGLRPIPSITTTWQIYLALAVLAFGFWRLDRSTFGRALFALRDDERAAASLGIDPVRTNLVAFVVSGMVAGLAGGLTAHLTFIITPRDFGFASALDILVFAIVGGTTSYAGPILGAALMTVLPEVLRQLQRFGVDPGPISLFVSGAILLAVIIFLPAGLISLVTGRRRSAGVRLEPGVPLSVGPPSADQPPRAAPTPVRRDEAGGEPLLSVRGLTKHFGGVQAVNAFDLEVRQGEIVGLIGPNGAGTTPIVNLLPGAVPPTSGRVTFAGTDVTGWSAHRMAQAGLLRTWQNIRLFRHLTVLENVLVGLALRDDTPPLAALLRGQGDAARSRALALLDRVGLTDAADRRASALAYGDRRRLEIMRGLAGGPKLLVLDEPAAGMTAPEAARIGLLLREIAADGIAVILIEHNVRLVLQTCDRVSVVNFGSRIAEGSPATVARDPRVVDAYLGQAELA
jgi:branched-chain amino acid transport system permease protein